MRTYVHDIHTCTRADIDGRHWPLPGDNAGMKKWPSQRDLSNLLAASNCGIELKTLF